MEANKFVSILKKLKENIPEEPIEVFFKDKKKFDEIWLLNKKQTKFVSIEGKDFKWIIKNCYSFLPMSLKFNKEKVEEELKKSKIKYKDVELLTSIVLKNKLGLLPNGVN